jgi:Tol biopolymer transport system component
LVTSSPHDLHFLPAPALQVQVRKGVNSANNNLVAELVEAVKSYRFALSFDPEPFRRMGFCYSGVIMSKYHRQSILKLCLLITTVLSSGCGQSNATDSLVEPFSPKGSLIYSDQSNIYSVNLENQKITAMFSTDGRLGDISIVGDWIYMWCEGMVEADGLWHSREACRVDLDGKNLEQLTFGAEINYGTTYTVSPRGDYMVYQRKFSGPLSILDLSRKTSRQISQNASFPLWSPDGRNIIFLDDGLVFYSIETQKITKVYRGQFASVDFYWSQNGKNISFFPYKDNHQSEIDIYNTESKELNRILIGEYFLFDYAWAPDNKHIVLSVHDKNGRAAMQLLNTDNAAIESISRVGRTDYSYNLVWSPSGTTILFNQMKGTNVFEMDDTSPPEKVYISLLDTQKNKIINVEQLMATRPQIGEKTIVGWWNQAWSPDGKYIAYLISADTPFSITSANLIVLSIDTGEYLQLEIPITGSLSKFFWMPTR